MKYTLIAIAALFLAAFKPGNTAYVQLVCRDLDIATQIAQAFTTDKDAGSEVAYEAVKLDRCVLLPFQGEGVVNKLEWSDQTHDVYSLYQAILPNKMWYVIGDTPGVKS